jgi:hypothetical protein
VMRVMIEGLAAGVFPPRIKCRMHAVLRLAEALSLPAGFRAWAPRLTP